MVAPIFRILSQSVDILFRVVNLELTLIWVVPSLPTLGGTHNDPRSGG